MKTVITWLALVYAVLFVVAIVLIIGKVSLDSANLWNWGWMIISIQIVYLVLSFKTVGPEEKAALLLFGRPLYEVCSGLVFVPWLICVLRKESRLTIQIQIPGEPEEVDKSGDDEKGVAVGKVLPIRATTGSYETVKAGPLFSGDPSLVADDPLSQRMTLEPSAQIRFKIKDIIKFIRTIGSVSQAKRQLRDTAEGVIKGEFAKRTPALIIAHWTEINAVLKTEIGKLVKDDTTTPGRDEDEGWGVEIETAQMLDADISRKVNIALSQVTEAKILRVKTVTVAKAAKEAKLQEAEGNRVFKTKEGQALADAREFMLLAEAIGTAKLAKLAKTPEGQIALLSQQTREMFKEADFSVIPGDSGGLFGTIAAIQEVLRKIHSKTP